MTTLELEQRFASVRYVANTTSSYARLELEPLVDTGSAVPIGISLASPPGSAFQSFSIYAPSNPVSQVLHIRLGAPQPNYRMDVRIRLGASQDVWLLAELADGRFMGMLLPTVITSSACFDAS